MNSKMILGAAVAAMIFSSCRKTENTTPDTRGVLGYQLKASDVSASNTGKVSADGTIQWHAGYAHPREMCFEAKMEGGANGENNFRTLDTSRIDLFAPKTRSFGYVALTQGTYKEVEMRIKLNPKGVAPAARLHGTYTSNTASTPLPVTLEIADACEIKTEVKDVSIDNNTHFAAVTSLDLSILSEGITEGMIRDAELKDGTLLITREVNTNLYRIVVDNLKNARHAVQVRNN